MRSRTSFFNPGLAKSLVKRFWPLMLAYLAVLLLTLPLQISSLTGQSWYAERLNYEILRLASEGVVYSALAALLMAMAMFSHLYNKRDCGLINSLPLRRETTWLTACFTGLLPLLLCPVLTWLVSRLLFAGNAHISAAALGTWLQCIMLANLAFYGLAVFCAMLTGNILAVPALFLVLNLLAYGLETLVRGVLDRVVYGYASGKAMLSWLSPLIYLLDHVKASDGLDGIYDPSASSQVALAELKGLPALTGYAIAGLVLLLLSLLLYRRRPMETAGDVLAVKPLRPLFRYGASLCAALVLPSIFLDTLGNRLAGLPMTLLLIALMLLGAAAGYYLAEMLLQKSFRVFRGRAWGILALWAVLACLTLAWEFDLFGYERRIPAPEEIAEVQIPSIGRSTDDPEAIALYRQLHQRILDNKDHNENRADKSKGRYIYLFYTLKDGSQLARVYHVDNSKAWVDAGNSELPLAQQISQLESSRRLANLSEVPITAQSILRCNADVACLDPNLPEDVGVSYEQTWISADQAWELYETCILPDMADSSLGTVWVYQDDSFYSLGSNIILSYLLTDPERQDDTDVYREYFAITVTMDAKRTLAWLEENKGITAVPCGEIYSPTDVEYY